MERAVLIGIDSGRPDGPKVNDWAEFSELARTAGAMEVGRVTQTRTEPDPALFIGQGKARYLAEYVRETSAGLVIAIQELSPVQIRNLEDLTGVRVIDRTDLILAIFAQRARSKEGKLQVELAQLSYLLPRLRNTGFQFSRLGGGIGTRGPGETKLEVDRRRVRHRITELRRELIKVECQRQVQRKRRVKAAIPTVALVGYTNAGKSTLFNQLTKAGVKADDRLFETLDPISRKIRLPNGREIILLDTVGFISNLPHQLVAAFKSTLEETVQASFLIKVLDATALNLQQQFTAIETVLKEIKIETKEGLVVLNKIDLLDSEYSSQRLCSEWGGIPISARTGVGIEELLIAIASAIASKIKVYRMLIPFTETGLVAVLHRQGRILEETYTASGVALQVELETAFVPEYSRFIIFEGASC